MEERTISSEWETTFLYTRSKIKPDHTCSQRTKMVSVCGCTCACFVGHATPCVSLTAPPPRRPPCHATLLTLRPTGSDKCEMLTWCVAFPSRAPGCCSFSPSFSLFFHLFLFSPRNDIFSPLPSSWPFFVQLIMIRNLSFFFPTQLTVKAQVNSQEIVVLCAQTTAVLHLPTLPIIPQMPSQTHRGSSDFLRFPGSSVAQIGLFSCILAALLHHSWEAFPSLFIYLSLTLPVNWEPKRRNNLKSLQTWGNGAGMNLKLHLNLTRRPPFFRHICPTL